MHFLLNVLPNVVMTCTWICFNLETKKADHFNRLKMPFFSQILR